MKNYKKLIKRFVKCEFSTHMFEEPEDVKPLMLDKVKSYVKRLGFTHYEVSIEYISRSRIIFKMDDDFGDIFFVNIHIVRSED